MRQKDKIIVEYQAFLYNVFKKNKKECEKDIKEFMKNQHENSEKMIKEGLKYFENLTELKKGKVYEKLRVEYGGYDEGCLTYYTCTLEEALKMCQKELKSEIKNKEEEDKKNGRKKLEREIIIKRVYRVL